MIKDIKLNTKPEIIISSLDADRLYALMESLPANSFAGEKELEAELARALMRRYNS